MSEKKKQERGRKEKKGRDLAAGLSLIPLHLHQLRML